MRVAALGHCPEFRRATRRQKREPLKTKICYLLNDKKRETGESICMWNEAVVSKGERMNNAKKKNLRSSTIVTLLHVHHSHTHTYYLFYYNFT